VGYCGLDRARQPLRGDEIRGCWDEAPASIHDDDGAEPAVISLAPAAEPGGSLWVDADA
jgi:hypothetical protein